MILRTLTDTDQLAAIQAHKEMALDNFVFLLGSIDHPVEDADWSDCGAGINPA
jgi:hypothetical protein